MIDIDREAALLSTSKNGEAWVMRLPGDIAIDLKARRNVQNLKSDLVFPSLEDLSKPRNVWNAWNVACTPAKLHGRSQDVRNSAATEMLRVGVDSRIVATALGHKSMNMMKRYAHVAPELVVEAARKAQKGNPAASPPQASGGDRG